MYRMEKNMVQIQRETSIRAGEKIVIHIPEDQIDKNAFLTIQHEKPHFLLPFTNKQVDDEMVLTYTLGKAVKLSFQLGSIDSRNHIDVFLDLLKVLVEECDDWFMKYDSFVLDLDYIYQEEGKLKLLYVPTVTPYAGMRQLSDLVAEIFRRCKMNDMSLENRILREMQDFQPVQMLRTLREYDKGSAPCVSTTVPVQGQSVPVASAVPVAPVRPVASVAPVAPPVVKVAAPVVVAPVAPVAGIPGDIQIQMATPAKEKTKKKEAKEKKESKEKKGLFGGLGKKKETAPDVQPSVPQASFAAPAMPAVMPAVQSAGDVTEIAGEEMQCARLVYIGNQGHDRTISLDMAVSQSFTVGRVDANAGRKQCDFEFPNKTRAVSRRHAALERKADGYYITDLGSSAGTYHNNQRLLSGAYRIQEGDKISFGNAGADYLFYEA